jgi:hypothetical protein
MAISTVIRKKLFEVQQHERYLENGPLGPIQKKRLAEQVKDLRAELKQLRQQEREEKKRKNK